MTCPCGGDRKGGEGCSCDPPFVGLRLYFLGFNSFPGGEGVWDLQVDAARVGYVVAPTLADAMRRAELRTERFDWAQADPMLPEIVRA